MTSTRLEGNIPLLAKLSEGPNGITTDMYSDEFEQDEQDTVRPHYSAYIRLGAHSHLADVSVGTLRWIFHLMGGPRGYWQGGVDGREERGTIDN